MLFPAGIALFVATILVILSQMKINVTNAYAGSLAWSNFFSRILHWHPGRVWWVFLNVGIALTLMLFGVFGFLNFVLGFYSNVAMIWSTARSTRPRSAPCVAPWRRSATTCARNRFNWGANPKHGQLSPNPRAARSRARTAIRSRSRLSQSTKTSLHGILPFGLSARDYGLSRF